MSDDIEYGRAGSTLEDFLNEEGLCESANEYALKQLIVWQLQKIMDEQHISKTELARRLETSRSQIDRILDPANEGVTVGMVGRAARAMGRTLRLEFA